MFCCVKTAGGPAVRRKAGDAPLQPITPERVLDELAGIAFADPRDGEAMPVKMADKLRALELLYKHLGLGDGGSEEGVVIVDDVGKEEVPTNS